jgi:hypothetical protein
MAATFTTTITAMYTLQQPNPNYVVNAMWKVTGTENGYVASIGGNTIFDSNQSSAFIPYDQLTQEIVVGWIPLNEIQNAQGCVQGQLNSLIAPPVVPENTPLPWGN